MGFHGEELSNREKTCFELGIKLGALFHQFIGVPVSSKNKKSLEKSIEDSVKNQPFVKDVNIKIEVKGEEYSSLSPEQLKAKVLVEYRDQVGVGKLEYKDGFPLMWIDDLYDNK